MFWVGSSWLVEEIALTGSVRPTLHSVRIATCISSHPVFVLGCPALYYLVSWCVVYCLVLSCGVVWCVVCSAVATQWLWRGAYPGVPVLLFAFIMACSHVPLLRNRQYLE